MEMEEIAMKADLFDKISHLEGEQLQQLYGLVLNYLNGQEDETDWDKLPEYQKERITESLKQADEGLGRPLDIVLKDLRQKYGLND
ncbi:hypothetical protein A0256_07765 [Mucilaginibacter sp. PAMC 26640]|nr:hypothetical protein A0256_07765 [Mucilaginibacter sp. PAMC 26640]